MENTQNPVYRMDAQWRIVDANEAFCRVFKCTQSGVVGRDVRELLRDDWRVDFRSYVARALAGLGGLDVTVPMVAPCGEQQWYKHTLEPLIADGTLAGYRATLEAYVVTPRKPTRRWWHRTASAPLTVWNFDADQLARAS